MDRLEQLRTMECALTLYDPFAPHDGPIDAHHHTGHRGIGIKSDDSKTFPLCHKHHMDFHDAKGIFRDWNKQRRREWQDQMVEWYDRILCDPEAF